MAKKPTPLDPAKIKRLRARVSPSRQVRPREDRLEILPADRLDLEALDWFIIRVAAGREARTQTILRVMGFGTCLPMRRVYQRFTRYRKTLRARPYAVLPGYLFVGISLDTPGWPELMAVRDVIAAVGLDGTPYRIDKCVIDHIAGQYASLYYPVAPDKRHNGRKPDFKVGDKVRILTGPFERQVVPVEKIGQEQAVVLLRMFGSDMPVAMRLDDLRPAGG